MRTTSELVVAPFTSVGTPITSMPSRTRPTETDTVHPIAPELQAHLLEAVVNANDTLRADFDLTTTIGRLIEVCGQIVEDSDVSVVLADERGALHVAGSSSERKRVLEQYQIDHSCGPTVETYETGEPSCHEELDISRYPWPRFAQLARVVGFRTIRSYPLRVRKETIGVLSIGQSVEVSRPPLQDSLLRVMAAGITVGFVNRRAFSAANELSRQLQGALTSRVLIEQAKGVVAARLDISIDDAFESLRSYARGTNQKLNEVAQSILDRRLSAEEVFRTARRLLDRSAHRPRPKAVAAPPRLLVSAQSPAPRPGPAA